MIQRSSRSIARLAASLLVGLFASGEIPTTMPMVKEDLETNSEGMGARLLLRRSRKFRPVSTCSI